MSPLLEVRDLHVHYGRLPVLRGVDLEVEEGSVVALLGPNGAGKTTLLKTVAGLLQPTSGEVLFDGAPVHGAPANRVARQGVCLIPEGRGIFPNLTVADNLRLTLRGHPDGRRHVLEHFPVLGERQRQLAGTLSGGEQQMLALARAVGTRPRLLMADELSLGLAPLLVQTIIETLERLHEDEGHTILLVEQYATHALRLADVIYVLARGEVVWSGGPDELQASEELMEAYLGAVV